MRSLLPATLALALAAGCSGGHGGGGGKSLTSGAYRISNAANAGADACQWGNFNELNGATFPVTVTGSGFTTTFGLYNHLVGALVTGDTFTVPSTPRVIDWTDTAATQFPRYDCVEIDTVTVSGSITAHDAFHTEASVMYATSAGDPAACVAANNSAYGLSIASFPCTSAGAFDATRQP